MQAQQLIDYLGAAVLLASATGQIELVNESTESLLGQSRNQLVGASLQTVFAANERLVELVARCHSQQAVLRLLDEELKLLHLQKTILVNAIFTPVAGAKGDAATENFNRVVIEINPMGLAQQAAAERSAVQRSQAARTLIRGLCHEIKNPLAGIRGAAQLAERGAVQLTKPGIQGDSQHQGIKLYTQIIIREVDRVNRLLERLSSAHQQSHIEVVAIEHILADCLQLINSEYKGEIALSLDCDTSLPKLRVDAQQITQVILNILKNAAYFALSNSSPRVSVSTRLAGPNSNAYLSGKSGVKITITDNGDGVAEHIKEQLFFPMVTTRAGGTGLGLSISQEIARHHGGIIDYTGGEGGACFSLYLPFT